MQVFSCPYDSGTCGLKSSLIKLYPERPTASFSLSNYKFVNNAICYYEISVSNSTLDLKNYNYTLKLTFDTVTNVGISLNNGTNYFDADDPLSVGF